MIEQTVFLRSSLDFFKEDARQYPDFHSGPSSHVLYPGQFIDVVGPVCRNAAEFFVPFHFFQNTHFSSLPGFPP